MKHVFCFFCLLALCVSICMLAFISCSKDGGDKEPWMGCPAPDNVGLMMDGGNLDSVILYCVGKSDGWRDTSPKTLKSYTGMCLGTQGDAGYNFAVTGTPGSFDIWHLENSYFRQKTAFLVEEYNKWAYELVIAWPCFWTAYNNGEVTITCDKVLFGEEPGTNLSQYFNISGNGHCMPVGIENPKMLYNYGEELPSLMCDFFKKEVWLEDEYCMSFVTEPEEKYDELTFSLTMPLKLEHVYEYSRDVYNTGKAEMKFTEKTYISNCTVKFNWEE